MNKLGKRKMVAYGLVLVGTLVGLLVDRLGRSGPGAASAASVVSNLIVQRPAAVSGGRAIQGPAIAAVFDSPARPVLEKTGADHRAARRNAFDMTAVMRGSFEEAPPEQKAAEAERLAGERERRRQEIAQFQSAHKLLGVTIRSDASWALVDDHLVRPGEMIDGFTLTSVERYRAHFVKDDSTVILALPTP